MLKPSAATQPTTISANSLAICFPRDGFGFLGFILVKCPEGGQTDSVLVIIRGVRMVGGFHWRLKKMKTSFFETIHFFSYRYRRNCYQLSCFSVVSNLLNLEKPWLWCNNTESTFSGALRLTLWLTIAEKVLLFFFETNRLLFVRNLPKLLSCFFFSVLSNFLI